MKSLIAAYKQIIDCRELKLYGTYFCLTQEQVNVLTECFFVFCNDLLNDFVLDWSFNGKSFRTLPQALSSRKMQNGAFIMRSRGNVCCEEVYNKTTFRNYERFIKYPPMPHEPAGFYESTDFAQYYETYVANEFYDPEKLKNTLLHLFDLEGKKHLGHNLRPDVFCLFVNTPMESNMSLYFGEFSIRIPSYCLDAEVNTTADRFLNYGIDISEQFPSINLSVELNAYTDTYSEYFGIYPNELESSSLRDYARCLYLTGCGWANILCPSSRTLIRADSTSVPDNISVESTPGGSLVVKGKSSVTETLIKDLKDIKQYLYLSIMPRTQKRALYYDMVSTGLSFNPTPEPPPKIRFRRYWEVLPLFPNELLVTTDYVEFRHHGKIDLEAMRKIMDLDT